jgi:urease subunit alpha
MFGAFGKATTHSAVTFVSQAAAADGLAEVLGMERRLVPVRHTRGITKESMIHNTAMPTIEIDPETGAIRVDGEVLASAPAETLPLAQRYFLF